MRGGAVQRPPGAGRGIFGIMMRPRERRRQNRQARQARRQRRQNVEQRCAELARKHMQEHLEAMPKRASVDDRGQAEGELCGCGCGKPLQRLPDGRLGVVTFSLPFGPRFNLPMR